MYTMLNKIEDEVEDVWNTNKYKHNSGTDKAAQFSDRGASEEWKWMCYHDFVKDIKTNIFTIFMLY